VTHAEARLHAAGDSFLSGRDAILDMVLVLRSGDGEEHQTIATAVQPWSLVWIVLTLDELTLFARFAAP
jgi:hypothetical protein